MRRSATLLLLLALAPRVSGAQSATGVLVKGWKARLDPQAERDGKRLTDLTFRAEGDMYEVIAGAPAIYWNPASVGRGAYRASATFTQLRGTASAEYYGLFIGGSRLDGKAQNYLYCAIAGNGTFLVKHRIGDEVHELAGRTAHRAVRGADPAGLAVNRLAWRVTAARTSCLVNGVEVWGYTSAALVGEGKLESLDGIAGVRVNHGVEVRIAGFTVGPDGAR